MKKQKGLGDTIELIAENTGMLKYKIYRAGIPLSVYPPSTTIDEPVINDASFDARNKAVFAISKGVPNLPIGCLASNSFNLSLSSCKAFVKLVFTYPGHIQFTLTLYLAKSKDKFRVNCIMAPLEGGYASNPTPKPLEYPTNPIIEETLIIDPDFFSFINGAKY